MGIIAKLKEFLPFHLKHSIRGYILNWINAKDVKALKKQHLAKPECLQGINVVGYFDAPTGLGQSVRSFSESAQAANIATTEISVTFSRMLSIQKINPPSLSATIYNINVIHINAILVEQAILSWTELLRDRYNIGYWHWELADFPDNWLPVLEYFDEIWVPTRFVNEAIQGKCNIPIVTIPHAIERPDFKVRTRSYFKLPPDDFLVLSIFDVGSVIERKNPFAMINAFEKAFAETDNVTLVVKIRNGETNTAAVKKLRAALERVKHKLIEDTTSKDDVWALINCCDTFISLHRSEGFGLLIAEAMLLSKPVIVTNYSGNTDFCNEENSFPVNYKLVKIARDESIYMAGNIWAEPDIEHAVKQLQTVYFNRELATQKAAKGKETIGRKYSREKIGATYLKYLS